MHEFQGPRYFGGLLNDATQTELRGNLSSAPPSFPSPCLPLLLVANTSSAILPLTLSLSPLLTEGYGE